ncbi:hypothetical protein [Pajaroellobacter abortibovis]|uniref:HTH HARE-type domain-containing protein n=1 Tax=Pajaroellobacter abortibovis TaxID=1882918 RepID=A0A1L6MWV7_9BACT|nr:hypothetical protein [Pajaroellobacter abortibovis]APS00041.1 hypothetical protein BCY86_04600 [Pajaroellobacter abortibovis]
MSSNLRTAIAMLASSFASSVLNVIRGASLQEILTETNENSSFSKHGPGRPKTGGKETHHLSNGKKSKIVFSKRQASRLGRRSENDICHLLDRIVDLLSAHPEGLRAEQIREQLKVEAKELPRPLAEGLATHQLIKQGQKRATTYFVKGNKKGITRSTTVKREPHKRVGRPHDFHQIEEQDQRTEMNSNQESNG